MSYILSEEQTLLQETVRRFGVAKIKPVIAEFEERGEFPKVIFDELASLQLAGIRTPEKYQGSGLDFLSYALTIEELAKYSLSLAMSLAVTGLPQGIISEFGSEAQKEKYLPDLARGKKLGAFSLTEAGAGSDAANLQTTAVKKGNDYVLNGSKVFVTQGNIADTIVVFARTSKARVKGISAFIVEKGTEGFSVGKVEKKLACNASPTAELIFTDCKIPAANLIGKEGIGFHIAMEALNSGRITIGASAVGLATRAFEEARDYAKERRQFGRPIAEFQGIQMMLADMATSIEAARLLVYKAAYLRDQKQDYLMFASMGKTLASDAAMTVTIKAVQIFGGNGYCQDYPVERFMREAKVLQIVEGTNQIQKIVIAKRILQ